MEWTEIAISFCPTHYFEDLEGNAWAIGHDTGTPNCGIYCINGSRAGDGASWVSPNGSEAPLYAVFNDEGTITFVQGSTLYLMDPETFAILDSNPGRSHTGENWIAFRNVRPGAATIWIEQREFDLSTVETLRTVNQTDWISGSGTEVYDPINHALISFITGVGMAWLYLDRIDSAGVTLGTVIGESTDDWRPVDSSKARPRGQGSALRGAHGAGPRGVPLTPMSALGGKRTFQCARHGRRCPELTAPVAQSNPTHDQGPCCLMLRLTIASTASSAAVASSLRF